MPWDACRYAVLPHGNSSRCATRILPAGNNFPFRAASNILTACCRHLDAALSSPVSPALVLPHHASRRGAAQPHHAWWRHLLPPPVFPLVVSSPCPPRTPRPCVVFPLTPSDTTLLPPPTRMAPPRLFLLSGAVHIPTRRETSARLCTTEIFPGSACPSALISWLEIARGRTVRTGVRGLDVCALLLRD